MQYENISGYKFIHLDDLYGLQSLLKKECQALGLLGTILLSEEGINVMLAGAKDTIERFEAWLRLDARFSDIWFKHSVCENAPFEYLKVRIKPEIITMRCEGIDPTAEESRYISPEELRTWYDTGKKFIILDTRNNFEIEFGKFKNAKLINLKSFTDIVTALSQFTDEERKMPIVTYCTGGVRCEKAAPLMDSMGFYDVYQLEGGILNYFEKCEDAHWEGECFVFDHRVAIDGQLRETGTLQCKDCYGPIKQSASVAHVCAASN